jgi:septum formation protein
MDAPELILASTSVYRRQLLDRLRLPYRALPPAVDEAAKPGEAPPERAARLAWDKAAAVARRHPDACVIGSDQVASCRGRVLDKPGDAATCRSQLEWLSGNQAEFHTAIAVICASRTYRFEHTDHTVVQLRTLGPETIGRYIEAEQPFDCAGGFKCEGLGIALFERLESSDPTGLIGLPLIALASALRAVGFRVP